MKLVKTITIKNASEGNVIIVRNGKIVKNLTANADLYKIAYFDEVTGCAVYNLIDVCKIAEAQKIEQEAIETNSLTSYDENKDLFDLVYSINIDAGVLYAWANKKLEALDKSVKAYHLGIGECWKLTSEEIVRIARKIMTDKDWMFHKAIRPYEALCIIEENDLAAQHYGVSLNSYAECKKEAARLQKRFDACFAM